MLHIIFDLETEQREPNKKPAGARLSQKNGQLQGTFVVRFKQVYFFSLSKVSFFCSFIKDLEKVHKDLFIWSRTRPTARNGY